LRPTIVNGSVAVRRLLLIANPTAGGGVGASRATALAAALTKRGLAADLHLTTAAGDATDRARHSANQGYDALVAIGGDGTVNEVLAGMADPSQPLGVLPVGTANVLACELGLPHAIEPAAGVLAGGHTRSLAIGNANGRRFLLFCGIGIDGAVVQRMHDAGTAARGKRKWLGPIVHTLRHWPQFTLRVTLADGELLDDLTSVVVSRVRNYGGVLRLPRTVDVDSDRLYVIGFRSRSRVGWLWQGVRGATRTMAAGRGLVVRATDAVQIHGSAPFQIDGDFGGTTPLRIELLAPRANILVPRRL
jgi:diacylglycerol kinase (ATP)